MPKVSVIIPVYNTDQYVAKTIESILNQTLYDIEIILINDGSKDNSLSILEQYAGIDKRIRLINQDNKGLSVSRNIGIEAANGEYILFMDSDDLLDKNTLEQCYKKSQDNNLEFVFFDADAFSDDDIDLSKMYSYNRSGLFEDSVFNGKQLLKYQINNNLFRSSVCLMFFLRDFITKNKISFIPNILHEDEPFTFKCYYYAQRVGRIDNTFFKRRYRYNSIMTTAFNLKNLNSYFTVIKEIEHVGNDAFVKMHIGKMLDSIFVKASNLKIKYRLKLSFFFFRYYKYIKTKSLIKLFINVKSKG